MNGRQNGNTQIETPSDPTILALHRALAKVYGDNGAEVDPSFLEIRKKCKERLRIQDIAASPILQEITTEEAAIHEAIKTYPGFYVRTGNDQVKQHHDYMPQNSVLLRDMPATFGATHLIELFQTLVLEDGSPCPMPNPEKIRSDGTTWLAVFSSVEDAQKALVVVRNKVLDGKNIRAVLRNETTRVQQMVPNHQKRDGMMPVMFRPMAPVYSNPMYGQTPIMPPGQPMYYPSPHSFSYYPYQQASPYQAINYGMSAFVMSQPPYGAAPPYAPYEMQMYGMMPTSPTMQNSNGQNAYGSSSNNSNNNNKPRRNNQYNGNGMNYNNSANNRYTQPKVRDPNHARYSKPGENALPSPSGMTATEVAVAALDSSSIPRSFSADADEINKSPSVPVMSMPELEIVEPAQESASIHVETVDDSIAPTPQEQIETVANNTDSDPEADRDSGNDASPRNGARKEGKRDSSRSGKNRSNEGDKRNGGRDGKNSQRQDKDGAAKRERKTPPVNLNLEKDFPTLQLGDNSKVSVSGKVAFNYANALKKASDDASPKPPTPVVPTNSGSTAPTNTNNNNANQASKKESRSSNKGPASVKSEPVPKVSDPVVSAPAPVVVKKVEANASVVESPVIAVSEPVKAPAPEKSIVAEVVPVSPATETPAVETEHASSGGKKAFSFIDAVRAKK